MVAAQSFLAGGGVPWGEEGWPRPPESGARNIAKPYRRELYGAGARLSPTLRLAQGSWSEVAEIARERGWADAFIKPQVGLYPR